jgi:hypothetical protein
MDELKDGERVEHRAEVHPMPLYTCGAMALGVAAAAIWWWSAMWWGLPVVGFVAARFAMQRANTKILVTNRRVIMHTGVVEPQSSELRLAQVESVVTKGTKELGTVTIVGSGGTKHVFENIKDPHALRDAVNRAAGALQPAA